MISLTSFAAAKQATQIKQGIAGRVYLQRGNYMPVPGRKPNYGKPVARTIWVYALTKRDQATADGNFFSNIKTPLIAKAKSDTLGNYSMALPPGSYSVFVEDRAKLYANSFDDNDNISPVEVKKGSLTQRDIVISSRAVY